MLGGLTRIDERYPVWEEGRRKVFVGVRTTPPTLRRLSEEYLVLPIGHAVFASIARDVRRHFEGG